jgi:hypothetical protein
MSDYIADRMLEVEVKALAEKNGLPFAFANQLIFTEIRQGVSIPDAIDWLKDILPSFTGRVS